MTKEYTDLILETMNDKFQQMLECFSVHSKEIADLRTELKEDIALVDAKVMGLAKRVDHVETSLTERIDQAAFFRVRRLGALCISVLLR